MSSLGIMDDSPVWPVVICVDEMPVGLGSWLAPNLILTCDHLLNHGGASGKSKIDLRVAPLFVDQGTVRAEVVGREPLLDLALLATEKSLPEARLPDVRFPERMGFAGDRQIWRAWGIPKSAVGRLNDRLSLETALGRVRRAVRSGGGIVSDTVGSHRYQLRSDGETLFESGFSGSAVRAASGVLVGMLTSRDGRTQAPTSHIGFLVSIEGAVETFPQLREHVGWRFEIDSRLRAAWRWEDDDLARPTLGSYFTGRDAAFSELLSAAEDLL